LISRQVAKEPNEMNEQIDNTPEVEPFVNAYPSLDAVDTAADVDVNDLNVNDLNVNDADVNDADVNDEGEEGEEGGEGFSAPEEYVEREKGERRRVGSDVKIEDINYKNVPLLSRFLDRRGRIMSRRKTRVSAKMQRRIVREVKRARHLALLPYTADQTRQVRRRR
jgi:small subunit ribosomal protein S18